MNFHLYRRLSIFLEKLCRLLFLLFLILMLYGFDSKVGANLSILAAIIHEAGHVIAALLTQAKIKPIKFCYDGLRLPLDIIKTTRKNELFVLLAGPFLNILCSFFILSKTHPYLYDFGAINLITGIANLLPCHENDGQRILMNLFGQEGGGIRSVAISALGLFFGMTILFFSLFVTYKTGYALWISSIYLIYTVLELEKMRKAAFFRKNEKN